MPAICRIGDVGVGICNCHDSSINTSGVIVTGASISSVEGQNIARIGDIVLSSCGHTGIIIVGSNDSVCEGSPIARVGDNFSGCFTGILVSGASTVSVN
jgi:uncharacterized Zn-binding protein involved in type VI secretion